VAGETAIDRRTIAGLVGAVLFRQRGVRGKIRIKGNINGKGERGYYMPGTRGYGQTQVDESRGERWFCSEDEAREAGWRPSR
jgi:hypothetical protein